MGPPRGRKRGGRLRSKSGSVNLPLTRFFNYKFSHLACFGSGRQPPVELRGV